MEDEAPTTKEEPNEEVMEVEETPPPESEEPEPVVEPTPKPAPGYTIIENLKI